MKSEWYINTQSFKISIEYRPHHPTHKYSLFIGNSKHGIECKTLLNATDIAHAEMNRIIAKEKEQEG